MYIYPYIRVLYIQSFTVMPYIYTYIIHPYICTRHMHVLTTYVYSGWPLRFGVMFQFNPKDPWWSMVYIYRIYIYTLQRVFPKRGNFFIEHSISPPQSGWEDNNSTGAICYIDSGGMSTPWTESKRSVFTVYKLLPLEQLNHDSFISGCRIAPCFHVRQNLHRCGRHCRYCRNAVPSSWQVEGEVGPGHAEGCLWYWCLVTFFVFDECSGWSFNQQILPIQQLKKLGVNHDFFTGKESFCSKGLEASPWPPISADRDGVGI